MTKEEKAVAFVEDFIKYGFRIDTMPTRMMFKQSGNPDVQMIADAQHQEYMWWHEYVSGAEKRLLAEARKVLE